MHAHDCLFASELHSGLHRAVLHRRLGRVWGEEWEKGVQELGLERAGHMDPSRVDALAFARIGGTNALRCCHFRDIYTDVPTFLAWMMESRGTREGTGRPPRPQKPSRE